MTTAIVKSALFVDFDNIFQGLFDRDRQHANAFARKPDAWAERLESALLEEGVARDFLIRRCYLNPDGSPLVKLDDEISPSGRRISRSKRDTTVVYRQFRNFFTRAGFEVIDCPSLTNSQKNAADIRIALDVLELVLLGTPAVEFVIASGDADFTPLLHRINARDKRSMLVSAGSMAAAVSSAATSRIYGEDMLAVINPPKVRPAVPQDIAPVANAEVGSAEVGLAEVGSAEVGSAEVEVADVEVATVEVAVAHSAGLAEPTAQICVYPASEARSSASWIEGGERAPSAETESSDLGVDEFVRTAGLPRADRQTWATVVKSISEVTDTADHAESVITRCRDAIAERGATFGREKVRHVLVVIAAGGQRIADSMTPLGVARAIVDGAVIRSMAAGATPSDPDIMALKRLVGLLPSTSAVEPGVAIADDSNIHDGGDAAETGPELDEADPGVRAGTPARSLLDPPVGAPHQVDFPLADGLSDGHGGDLHEAA